MARITFDKLRLNRAVLEVRYPKGYLYWDVCGKCIHEINAKSNQGIDFSELTQNECVLRFVEKSEVQASFGLKHMTVSGMKLRNINVLKESAPLIFDTVKTHLQIRQISRAGFRLFYVLRKDSYEQAEEFVNRLQLCSVSAERFKGFGNKLSAAQATVLAIDELATARISVAPAKRSDADDPTAEFDEFAPRYAALVDIDFYRENVSVEEFDLERFMHQSYKKTEDHVTQLLNR